MPPKKRKRGVEATSRLEAEIGLPEPESGSAPKKLRADSTSPSSFHTEPQGLLRLPIELQEEILDHLQHPTLWTTVGYDRAPVISPAYTERNKALRSLASTSVVYRRVFLPVAWRHVLICTIGETDNRLSYYKTIGDMLERKCQGLENHPELGQHVQCVLFFQKHGLDLTWG